MGNITLELDSNFVAPSSRVRDEQQTKKCEFLIGNRNLMKMTHTPKSSVIIIMAGPKEGHGHRQKKKKNFTSQSIWQKIERMTLLFRFDAYNSHILVNKKERERDGQGERESFSKE